MKLQPYRQRSVKEAQAGSGKLAKRFYGPFQVIDRVGKVAYHLKLPDTTRIHPVFHYSLLKPFHGDPTSNTAAPLSKHFLNDQPLIIPLAILDYLRHVEKDSWEVLVQWKGLSPDETSWEDWAQLQQDHHLEDKVILQGSKEVDSSVATTAASEGQTREIDNAGVQIAKVKRRVTRPAYLRDYA